MLSPDSHHTYMAQVDARIKQDRNDTEKVHRRFVIAACIWGLFCLSLMGGVIFVAIHFIQKFW